MRTPFLLLCLLGPLAALSPAPLPAQTSAATLPDNTPTPAPTATPAPTPTPATPAPTAAPTATPAPADSAAPTATPAPSATPAVAPEPVVPSPAPLGKGEIRLNFQNAAVADVLNYLSEAAGFIVTQEAPVPGVITVVSKQAMSAEEAVDLINAALVDRGYAALRNGRVLKIVSRRDTNRLDTPVKVGNIAQEIPRKDEVVTQIVPVRHVDATKLVENLRPLLSPETNLSANEASNALLIVDTQTNIHRIVEIVHALDTSIASIASIKVFPLKYADAKALSGILNQIFAPPGQQQGGGRGGQRNANLPPWAAAFMNGRGEAGGGQSAAQQAASRVVTVADEKSNAIVVSAPEAALETIADIIAQVDTNVAAISEVRLFELKNADATEMAALVTTLYTDAPAGGNRNNRQQQQQQQAGNSQRAVQQARVAAVPDTRTNSLIVSASRDMMSQIAQTIERLDASENVDEITETRLFELKNADATEMATLLTTLYADLAGGNNRQRQQQQTARSQRALQQTSVMAVADPRTNSVAVKASHETMAQIALQLERLDASGAKKEVVRVYSLENADPDNVATILRGLFSGQNNTNNANGAQPASNTLNKRSATGASSNATNMLNTRGR